MSTHIFFGYTKNCRRVAKILEIPSPIIVHSIDDILRVRGDVSEHLCLPWEGSCLLHDTRVRLRENCNITTTTYHVL